MDDDLLPLSALQHLSYCPRQFALIHQEQQFTDNVFTLRGQRVHERVDELSIQTEAGVRVETAVPLMSRRLGLIGKADRVEYWPDGSIRPVEYKHGRRKRKVHDQVQLAAQALCLEEMTGRPVPRGDLYYHSSRRRLTVDIDATLRAEVERLAIEARAILASGRLPPPVTDSDRCRHCSLIESCQPDWLDAGARHRLDTLSRTLFQVEDEA